MGKAKEFGELFKQLRRARGQSLRSFCLMNNLDAQTISKIERGIPPAFMTPASPRKYALMLGLSEGSQECSQFVELAMEASSEPAVMPTDAEMVAALPPVFRTESGKPLDPAKIPTLIRTIRENDFGR